MLSDAYRYLALAYHRAGRDTEALSIADKSITLDPLLEFSYNVRTSIHESLGQRDEAIADYRKVLMLTLRVEDLRTAREGLQRLGAAP
jgi:tetratricopeptide (TPR) repeat protein